MKSIPLFFLLFLSISCTPAAPPAEPAKGISLSEQIARDKKAGVTSNTKVVGGLCKVTDNGDGTSTTTCMDGTTFRTTNGMKTPELPSGAP